MIDTPEMAPNWPLICLSYYPYFSFFCGWLSSKLSLSVISCPNGNVWACDWLANERTLAHTWRHLCQQRNADGSDRLHTSCGQHCMAPLLPTITILPLANEWSNGQASPRTCAIVQHCARPRNLKIEKSQSVGQGSCVLCSISLYQCDEDCDH